MRIRAFQHLQHFDARHGDFQAVAFEFDLGGVLWHGVALGRWNKRHSNGGCRQGQMNLRWHYNGTVALA